MSLHDIDKKNGMRANPLPNADDAVMQRMAHGTQGFTLKFEDSGDVAKLIIKDGQLKIYRNDGTLLAQGGVRDSDGDGAFEVARPGDTL